MPRVISVSAAESQSDSESEDELAWEKRKATHSLARRQVRSWWRTTDDEADGIESEIDSTRARAGDAQSEHDSVANKIGDGKGNRQSHPHSAASSAHHSAFASTLFESTDPVKPQSGARVGGNGEWGIHGIIGKEVIDGKVYYCVDWEPTMMPLDELWGAERFGARIRGKRASTAEENEPYAGKETPRPTSEVKVRWPS